ncbi:MAG TPA: site-specific DNA-methyltransferase, partial [Planctomycetaceae bacterium]|nr:site-specific DNA-methyltransferase [Planctomycetaceae bacterium]
MPAGFVDLLILDPPYNLSKDYNGQPFHEKSDSGYREWFRNVVLQLRPILAADATVYVCSDWKTSILVAPVLQEFFQVRNRITWEREKGRGAKSNWKNNTEDIWYCTLSDSYLFNVDAVKLKRKVVAPYRDANGKPKDWQEGDDGNYRLTYPSNIWTDITIPFWSMPENTDHPTQKPEKLIAKLILSSSNEGDFVFDPFLGSGTTAVVAKKLHRHFSGIEQSVEYCCWAQKRLSLADADSNIQGYSDGTFWERNT